MTDITHYTAGLGKARSGMAWRGKAGLGMARQGHRASKPCALYVKWDSHDEKRKS